VECHDRAFVAFHFQRGKARDRCFAPARAWTAGISEPRTSIFHSSRTKCLAAVARKQTLPASGVSFDCRAETCANAAIGHVAAADRVSAAAA
jgi:hypothetical protein